MTQGQPPPAAPSLLSQLYEQHWLHVRHLENERLSLTSLYALLAGGGVIFLFGQSVEVTVQRWVMSFLLLVTLIAAAISWRLSKRLADYRINVDKIATDAGLSQYLVPRPQRGGGPFRTQYLLAVIYLGALGGLGYLFTTSFV